MIRIHTRSRALSVVAGVVIAALAGCDEHTGTPGDTSPDVRVVPEVAQLETGESLDFDALLNGTDADGVNWTILGDPPRGSITPEGVYTAPDTIPDPPTVVIEATVQAVLDRPGRAEVTIVPPAGARFR